MFDDFAVCNLVGYKDIHKPVVKITRLRAFWLRLVRFLPSLVMCFLSSLGVRPPCRLVLLQPPHARTFRLETSGFVLFTFRFALQSPLLSKCCGRDYWAVADICGPVQRDTCCGQVLWKQPVQLPSDSLQANAKVICECVCAGYLDLCFDL